MTASSKRDGWDWPYILYVGRVWLCYTEAEIWQLTPRQLYAQLSVHDDITRRTHGTANSGKAARTGYIDQIPGW